MADDTYQTVSFNQALNQLPVGETVAVAKRFPRCGDDFDLGAAKGKLRATVNPAVSRARIRNTAEYISDSGSYITTDGNIVVTVAITRTA